MGLNKDLRKFIELLNSNDVEYIIAGAYAYSFYARPRFTQDIDFFVRTSDENATNMMQVIEHIGFASLGLESKDFLVENQVIQLGVAPNRIDILTSISGVTFEEAWPNSRTALLDEIPVRYLGREDLIRNKKASGRPQDFVDVAILEREQSN
ncbi:MAG: hypothetical protein AMXMBFR84_15460 [Candidatus Hydrogenedentota bacterium]